MRRKTCILAIVLASLLASSVAQEKKRSLLFIGQSKGYQHESISTAMVTLFNLGRSSRSGTRSSAPTARQSPRSP